jgi:hypothetical protein
MTHTQSKGDHTENKVTISAFEVVGCQYCVSHSDGLKLYARLFNAIAGNKHATLSFLNVSVITPSFLNAAIGQLYNLISKHRIKRLLKVEDMSPGDLLLLKLVVANAKEYFGN